MSGTLFREGGSYNPEDFANLSKSELLELYSIEQYRTLGRIERRRQSELVAKAKPKEKVFIEEDQKMVEERFSRLGELRGEIERRGLQVPTLEDIEAEDRKHEAEWRKSEAAASVVGPETGRERDQNLERKMQEVADLIAQQLKNVSVEKTGDGNWRIQGERYPGSSLEVGTYGDGTSTWKGYIGIILKKGSTIYAPEDYPPYMSAAEIADAAHYMLFNPQMATSVRGEYLKKAADDGMKRRAEIKRAELEEEDREAAFVDE